MTIKLENDKHMINTTALPNIWPASAYADYLGNNEQNLPQSFIYVKIKNRNMRFFN